jgi:signal transduction histidine kinase
MDINQFLVFPTVTYAEKYFFQNFYKFICQNQKLLEVEMSKNDMDYMNKPCVIYFIRDITQQIAMENKRIEFNSKLMSLNTELKRIDKMKTNWISNISHELRTPLVSIRGYSELIYNEKSGSVNEKQKNQLQIVLSNVDRVITLVNDLLDFSRLQLKELKLYNEQFNLLDIIKQCIDIEKPKLERNCMSIVTDYDADDFFVFGDKEKLSRVILNILDNAIKFGFVDTEIVINVFKSNFSFVQVKITNSGSNIPENELQKIFSKFYQVDDSITREKGGTGIGLALCEEIIKLHNGIIGAYNSGKNSVTFYFELPLINI